MHTSSHSVRQIVAITYSAMLVGMIALILYFRFIGGHTDANLALVGVLNVPSLVCLTIGLRYLFADLQLWLDRLHAGASPSEVPPTVRRKVLALVPRLTLLSVATWILAAALPIVTFPIGPGGLGRGIVLALGITGVGAVLTPAIIYFAADLAWRPAVHSFFPDGRLSAVAPKNRPILPRLLTAFLLASVWLPSLLVLASLSRSAEIVGHPYTRTRFLDLLVVELILLTTCVIVSVALAILVTRGITDPVRALQAAMGRVERQDLDAEVAVTTNDEIGYLAERFNQMTAGLRDREHIRHIFGQYVTAQVAEAVLRGDVKLGGERAEVSVLMTDLRDFTTLCESMEPEELVTLLNRYFDVMIDAIQEFGGTLDKFVGDAIITVFNAPLPQRDHPLRAVLTALRMRERLAAFNAAQRLRGEPELCMGMGIHTGPAVVGNVGSEGKKVEYTAMGDTVNVAARLEGLTKEMGGDICLSAETFRRVRDLVLAEDPVFSTVKGRKAPVTVYSLIDLRTKIDSSATRSLRARDRVHPVHPVTR